MVMIEKIYVHRHRRLYLKAEVDHPGQAGYLRAVGYDGNDPEEREAAWILAAQWGVQFEDVQRQPVAYGS
jgi:hypothetical protein